MKFQFSVRSRTALSRARALGPLARQPGAGLRALVLSASLLASACGGGDSGPTASPQVPQSGNTATSTSGVLCGYAGSGTQQMATRGTNANSPTVATLPYTFSWTCSASARVLASNGVPNHDITGGAFATAISPQTTVAGAPSINVSYTLAPALAASSSMPQFAGYSINGLKMEPGTAGTCTDAGQCNEAGGGGMWRMEALGSLNWDFGVDSNKSHVQPTGEYHIHGMPEKLMAKLNKGTAMALVGWAADGFPVYARYGYTRAMDASSATMVMRGSYRTKAAPDAGRPSTNLVSMGSFRQDWEYVAGLGDLDECNGRTGVTPEFPSGIYHYYITDSYPYIHRCVKGTAAASGGPPGPPG